jgi:hypothetical protein
MSAKNCNWFLPTTALISALLSVSTLSAQSQSDLSRSGQWRIAGQDVPTFHNDRARSGIQRRETSLTPSNVNTNQFGKLRSFGVDADVYAQPLYISKYKMADGKRHNVLFVATAHDSIYAFDADGNNPADGQMRAIAESRAETGECHGRRPE